MLGQNLQNVVGQIMDFYLAKTYKKGLPKTEKSKKSKYILEYRAIEKALAVWQALNNIMICKVFR